MQIEEKSLQELIRELPPDKIEAVKNFVQLLLTKQERQKSHKLRQNWAGALEEFKDQFTSIDLQKKSLLWRGD